MAVDAYTPLLVTCYEFAGPLDVHDEDESFLSTVRVPIRRRISFPHSQGAASHTSLRLLVFCASNIAGVNTNNSFDRKNGRGTHTEKRSYRILTGGSHGIFYACPEGCRRKSILFPSFFPLIPYPLFLCPLINFNNNLFDFDETRADYNFFNRFLI